jgi:ankyrin repeat protein
MLISNGAVLNYKNNMAESPLYMASWNHGHAEVAEMLISNGAIVNDRNKCGSSPLYMASRNRSC